MKPAEIYIDKTETVTPLAVAKALGTTPMMVKAAIKNGSLPIGFVARKEGSTQDRIIIVKARWERWRRGEDMVNVRTDP